MDDPTLWTTRRQAEAIAKGELGSSELVEAQLARIEAVNPALNAVVSLDAEAARAGARAADDAVAKGEELGPLHGVPITLKDAYTVEGWISTGGSTLLRSFVPDQDAPAAGALRRAGVVLLGRSNVPEWSGDLQTYNEVFGTTNNPWDQSRVPGGSSGGAAVAVATGMSSFELGTDIGGSVRIPSAFCGVCGHKPSHGVVPTAGYLDHPGVSLAVREVNVFGPLARSVDDLEYVLDVVAGPSPRDAVAWRLELPPARATEASGLRVAAWLDEASCPTDPDLLSVLETAVSAFERAGARVDATARPPLDWSEAIASAMATVGAEVSISPADDAFEFLLALEGQPMPEGLAQMTGSLVSRHRSWLQHQELRQRHHSAWDRFFEDWDVLLAPVCFTAAIAHDQSQSMPERTIRVAGVDRPYLDLVTWTCLIGSAELPSTVVPIGFTSAGLPVGIQVIGPHLEDRTSLAAARILEQVLGGYQVPPL